MRLTLSSPALRGSLRIGLCASAFVGALGLAQNSASAQTTLPVVACDTLPNPIYGIGGSAATTLIKRVGQILSVAQPAITVIYADQLGACSAMQSLVTGTKMTGTAKYWVSGNTSDQTCTLPTNGQDAEWGSMAQQSTTCAGITGLPNTVGDYLGPISGFSLIVPVASQQQVISAEALYSIYGLGAAEANITPWTNPATLASRTTTSAAGLLLAKAVGIPLTRPLKGIDGKDQKGVIALVTTGAAVTDPESAIGFVSTEAADAGDNRTKIRSLAYQHKGQLTGYYPDSDTTSFDKINIREGRYFLWNPHHFFARTDANKNIVNPDLAKFISYITSTAPLPGPKPFLDVTIENGNVPVCAMHVTRDDDMGPLASFQPDEPCGCYFDFIRKGATDCTPCTTDTECTDATAPKCRHNFCEVK